MNLWLAYAVMRHDRYDTGGIDTYIVREDYTMHGGHRNSQGKEILMQLTAERLIHGHYSSISSILIITHARVSHYSLNPYTYRYLTCIDCSLTSLGSSQIKCTVIRFNKYLSPDYQINEKPKWWIATLFDMQHEHSHIMF